jgi:hypothetical protein
MDNEKLVAKLNERIDINKKLGYMYCEKMDKIYNTAKRMECEKQGYKCVARIEAYMAVIEILKNND